MPFLTQPKGSAPPDVSAFAGMPMEAVESAVAPATEGLWNTFKGAWQNIRPELRGLDAILGRSSAEPSPALSGLQAAYKGAGTAELTPAGYSSVRSPKPGGVLSQVLGDAAERQGAGQNVSPGASRLLNHYSNLIRK